MLTRWDTYNNDLLPDEKLLPCGDLFERMYIWWDGTVNPCDVDYKSTLALGNVKIETIKEIWNGKAYSELREAHLSGSRSKYKFVPNVMHGQNKNRFYRFWQSC